MYPECVRGQKGQRCFLDSLKFCENMKTCYCHVSCLSKKKKKRILLAQAQIRLLTLSVEKMKAKTLNPSSAKVLNVWKEGYTEILNWREEERSRNRMVS